MKIDRVDFYVEDAKKTSKWFINNLGFEVIAQTKNNHTSTQVIVNKSVCLAISSALNNTSAVAKYLDCYAEGVANIVFQVRDLELIIKRAKYLGVKILQQPQITQNIKWAKIAGWESLEHTLIEYDLNNYGDYLPDLEVKKNVVLIPNKTDLSFSKIDHIVLNVAKNQLPEAVNFYQSLFDLKTQQTFNIKTNHSGLYSKALIDSTGELQFNINEPTSNSSQIQQFLNINGGGGIQHLALSCPNILTIVQKMRSRNNSLFLSIPQTYYNQLKQKLHTQSVSLLKDWQWEAIKTAEILVDWNEQQPNSLLMQIFTQPMLKKPTFFLELIERREQAIGFGERNFQALFEAVERQQFLINK